MAENRSPGESFNHKEYKGRAATKKWRRIDADFFREENPGRGLSWRTTANGDRQMLETKRGSNHPPRVIPSVGLPWGSAHTNPKLQRNSKCNSEFASGKKKWKLGKQKAENRRRLPKLPTARGRILKPLDYAGPMGLERFWSRVAARDVAPMAFGVSGAASAFSPRVK